MAISGPSMSGKTILALKLIDNLPSLLEMKIEKIYYFYNSFNKKFEDPSLSHITFINGLPSENGDKLPENCLIVIDDFMAGKNRLRKIIKNYFFSSR